MPHIVSWCAPTHIDVEVVPAHIDFEVVDLEMTIIDDDLRPADTEPGLDHFPVTPAFEDAQPRHYQEVHDGSQDSQGEVQDVNADEGPSIHDELATLRRLSEVDNPLSSIVDAVSMDDEDDVSMVDVSHELSVLARIASLD